jgi:hypothetical protein
LTFRHSKPQLSIPQGQSTQDVCLHALLSSWLNVNTTDTAHTVAPSTHQPTLPPTTCAARPCRTRTCHGPGAVKHENDVTPEAYAPLRPRRHHRQCKGAQGLPRFRGRRLNLHHCGDGVPPHTVLHQQVVVRPGLQYHSGTQQYTAVDSSTQQYTAVSSHGCKKAVEDLRANI